MKVAASAQMANMKRKAWQRPEVARRTWFKGVFMARYRSMLRAVRVKILEDTATPGGKGKEMMS